jgi:hypothetical protein
MGIVSDGIFIRRRPEAVYDLAWRPERATEWIAGMVATANPSIGDTITGVGTCFDWTYRMAGLTYRGSNRIAAGERPGYLREESSGDLNSTWEWRFEPAEPGTNVHLTISYIPPLGWLGRLLDPPLLRALNARALRRTLGNLKQLLEGQG